MQKGLVLITKLSEPWNKFSYKEFIFNRNILLKRGNFNNKSVPSNLMSDVEYSVITSDVKKSFDCIRVGYNLDIMRQSACLVLNPITVYSYGFLFNCTTVGQASDSMTALTSWLNLRFS